MSTNLSDLNNHLFAQLDRLNNEGLEGEKLKEEIDRSQAITAVSVQIISNANLVFNAAKFKTENFNAVLPKQFRSVGNDPK